MTGFETIAIGLNFVVMRCTAVLGSLALALLPTFGAFAILDLVVEAKTFHVPGSKARVEVNMAFLAGTMENTMNERGFMQNSVEVLTLIEQNGVVIAYGKTTVSGPERTDSSQVDLLHQEFFSLAPGAYDLTVEAFDLGATDTTKARYGAPLVVGELSTGVTISDILFAERIVPSDDPTRSKFGYEAVPLISDYFPPTIGNLNVYAEVYGTDNRFGTDSLFLLSYAVQNFETKKVFGPFKRSLREKGRSIVPVMAEFDIGQLPSGNYIVLIEVRDRAGELVAEREQFFQRNNPVSYSYDLQSMDELDLEGKFSGAFSNADSLAEHIASLGPIAAQLERKIIADRYKDHDLDLMKRFFYSFWANRSADPEQAWATYHTEVMKVNRLYGCRIQKGYASDRGRIYLQYGPPNTEMNRFNEMDTYPYTIWHYYRAGKYTNRRFVFYQPDLISNCMQLLHSEVPGEPQNAQWNQILHSRNTALKDVQVAPVNTLGGERANEFFEQPR